jgi:glutamyl-tRNA reductase
MKLIVAGVSHKTAPVEVRESLAFPEESLPTALADLCARDGVQEAMILSTCNRVEITLAAEDGCDPGSVVRAFLNDQKGASARNIEPHLYKHEGREAIHHLFRVASSLDSMVVGEPQILGQLKAAYGTAKDCGSLAGWLGGVVTRSFSVAKRVRSETGIGQMAVSVSYAAVELARRIFGSLSGRTVMILGAGKMSELAARHLRRSGVARVLVTNRTYERALESAHLFDGEPVEYGRYLERLPEADIVIASTGAGEYILGKDDMAKVIQARRNKPMFLIDIAVPRNINPEVNSIDNVYLYDIDDLGDVVKTNVQERMKEAGRAEELVAEEVERTMVKLKVAEVTPAIVQMQTQLEQIRATEMEKMRRRLGPLTEEQWEGIEAMTHAMMNKVAHGPISQLREHAGKPESAQMLAALRKAFRLQD